MAAIASPMASVLLPLPPFCVASAIVCICVVLLWQIAA
jgi:hypothetical protein